MAITEADAKKKWCPFGRVNQEGIVVNRYSNGDPAASSHCLGSKCMAWRWQVLSTEDNPRHGFCGLAGVG